MALVVSNSCFMPWGMAGDNGPCGGVGAGGRPGGGGSMGEVKGRKYGRSSVSPRISPCFFP